MSTVIIGGGGGGHNAMKYLGSKYHTLTPAQQAAAVQLVLAFVEDVNDRFGTDFSTTEL